MTAINCATVPDGSSGFILTDSVGYNGEGAFVGHSAKTFTLPHSLSAVACRGDSFAAFYASTIIGDFDSFDAIEEKAPAALFERLEVELSTHAPSQYHEAGLEVIVLGWSQKENAVRMCIAESNNRFKFQRSAIYIAPDVDIEGLAAAGIEATLAGIKFSNVQQDLIRIMNVQRREPMQYMKSSPDRLGHVIGGAAVLTAITERGIQQRVVHRWNDKVGGRITIDSLDATTAV